MQPLPAIGLKFGIEVEFFLSSREEPGQDLFTFTRTLANTHNQLKRANYPSMFSDLDGKHPGPNKFQEWQISDDGSLTDDLENFCM
jgi:hypothetical protein